MYHIIIRFVLFVIGFHSCFSQENYLQNPSLEGNSIMIDDIEVPAGWFSCQKWSDPDILRNNSSMGAIDGNTYVLMRTRAVDYYDGGVHDSCTTEYMVNQLINPLVPGGCYRFTVYLAYTPWVISNTWEEDVTSHPVKFEIRGTNDICPPDMATIETYKLLAVTDTIIKNTDFEKYSLMFNIKDSIYNYLFIRAVWDTDYMPKPYNGILAVDHMYLELVKYIDQPTKELVYYTRIPPLQLHAANGNSWEWTPPESLNNPYVQNPFMLSYDSLYIVTIMDNVGCAVYQEFKVEYICEVVYSTEFFQTKEVYYKMDQETQLIASAGINYQWDETVTGLSDYTKQNPVVTDYFDSITVEIHDLSDDHCLFREKFKMIVDCDSLFQTGVIIHYDTIHYGEEIILDPGEGNLSGYWEPSEGLSSAAILTPEASPKYNTTYTVNIQNNFNDLTCQHKEIFHIVLELEIPNVITPGNMDGDNDFFRIPGLSSDANIIIYDKSGRIVFEKKPYNNLCWWNGTLQGTNRMVHTGNYWYVIKVPSENKVFTGYVFVIR